MAKKQVKGAKKKSVRIPKSKSTTAKKGATKKSRAPKNGDKYEQTGAPWWKMHLPE